ncbi:MAG TPA: type I restriction-modification enzyme R subunit C-terminal domain-containing protein [Solirubrobacteraceae bacterium]|nr:type I restriction-modification enzyme R subunit C-terminal domain-containing protein [Solirubrobacteraceae bacterium]
MRLVEYRDFVADTVRSLFPDPQNLRSKWRSRVGRHDVLDALGQRAIDIGELAERTGLGDADPLDVLVHFAWSQPLRTRTDRARRVRREHAAFFAAYQPAAREILAQLLDKYTEHGIGQLDDLNVLEVPPLSSMGSPAEIADRFGSPDALHEAVGNLADLLYAA